MTEPSTSSLWLHSGTLKYFGKSGWETIGSEGINSSDIPTKLSELTNDVGYITSDSLSSYAKTEDIPTNVSELTNDKGYITGTSVSNVEVVSELPESPDSTTLYLIVSDE